MNGHPITTLKKEEFGYKELKPKRNGAYLGWSIIAFGVAIFIMGWVTPFFTVPLMIVSSFMAAFYSWRLVKEGWWWATIPLALSFAIFIVLIGGFFIGLFRGINIGT